MSLRTEFEAWLRQSNKPRSGKANSYLTGIEDVQTIAEASAKFKIPSVFDMPDDSLLSLKDYIDTEARKESHEAGSGAFNNVPGLHGVSYWRDGFCSAAISKLLGYRAFVSLRTKEENVLSRFRAWLSLPERNHGRGYKPGTIDRYVDAIVNFDAAFVHWGVDLKGRKLHEIVDVVEFTKVEQLIRSRPEFDGYNNNVENGNPKNLNGTGNGDPSAALTQFRLYLETGAEKKPDATSSVFDVSTAVKLFASHRLDEDWVKVLKRDGYEGLHERYAAMNPETLRGMNAAEFDAWVDRELWAARTFFCGQNIKKMSDADKKAFCEFIAATKKNSRLLSNYLGKDAKLPNGVGPVVATELLMKFHPLDYCNYNVLMLQGLKALGLVESDKMPNVVSVAMYQKLMGHAAMLLEKLTDAGVPRRFDEKADAKPDYITVNEFLWWCKEYQNLIKEKVMASRYKPTEIKKVEQKKIDDFSDFIKKLEKDVEDIGLKYAPGLMKRFVCAQLAKPFVVLTGLSGSGKTKLAEAFTKWIGVANTVNVVPVGADWTNNEKLLGYPNALDPEKYVMPDTGVLKLMLDANENEDLPFFLILDEMNLSHVERYFADFLSTMESNDGIIELYDSGKRYAEDGREIPPSFKFPKNLFVIGTMNVDETTYMFSPKVLDRAQVIEFRVSEKEMTDFLAKPGNPKIDDLAGKGAVYAKAFLDLAAERKTKQPTGDELTKVKDALASVFPSLAELGAEFGYRSAIEILTFVAYYLEASGYKKLTQSVDKEKCLTVAIDAGMLQKLLPKLHGSLNRLGPVVDALISKVSKKVPQANGSDAEPMIEKLYPLTYEKLQRMKLRVEKNGFTSFAEA